MGPADEVVDAFVRNLRPAGPEVVERARGQILDFKLSAEMKDGKVGNTVRRIP
ncbi:hypothetical protein ACTMTF_44630 [Nonomuraea sp. ZG12]|uniref:hypothetical protein n=1 Tax=Nonomuraea sp. ZG12 TaxID=3452207 RepID=UPI003F8CCBB8